MSFYNYRSKPGRPHLQFLNNLFNGYHNATIQKKHFFVNCCGRCRSGAVSVSWNGVHGVSMSCIRSCMRCSCTCTIHRDTNRLWSCTTTSDHGTDSNFATECKLCWSIFLSTILTYELSKFGLNSKIQNQIQIF